MEWRIISVVILCINGLKSPQIAREVECTPMRIRDVGQFAFGDQNLVHFWGYLLGMTWNLGISSYQQNNCRSRR